LTSGVGVVERQMRVPRRAVPVRHFGRWLALITAGGLALRIFVIMTSSNEAVGGDGWVYSNTPSKNLAGHWFISLFSGKPDATHPPVWTLILTGWAALGQHTFFRQQLLAAVIGTCTVALVGVAGRRIAGDRAGLVAATIAAVYAGLWLYERALLSETFLFVIIGLMLILAYSFLAQPSMRRAVLLGAMCGLLAMTRSEEILVLPFLVAPLILAVRTVPWRTRILWLVAASALTVAVITPWTIYNLGRFQKPIFLSTNGGGAAATGNCQGTYYGPDIGWYDIKCFPAHYSADPSVSNGQFVHYGLTYAEHHLSRLPLVVFAREGRAFGYWNPFQQTYLDNKWQRISPFFGKPTSVWVYDLRLVSYWVLLLPALGGCFVLRRRRIPVYPLLAFFLIVAVTVATAYGETRYRAAAEVPFVILAGIGIEAVLPKLRRSTNAEGERVMDETLPPEHDPEALGSAVTSSS
jgi:4-amino-4-deoxy-L-arabinose transferase-like glycosyltransferase